MIHRYQTAAQNLIQLGSLIMNVQVASEELGRPLGAPSTRHFLRTRTLRTALFLRHQACRTPSTLPTRLPAASTRSLRCRRCPTAELKDMSLLRLCRHPHREVSEIDSHVSFNCLRDSVMIFLLSSSTRPRVLVFRICTTTF